MFFIIIGVKRRFDLTLKVPMVLVLVVVIVFCPPVIDARQASVTVSVIVELDGFCVSDLLPQDYVSTNSPTLDSSVFSSSRNIARSIDIFIQRSFPKLGSVNHVYRL